MAQSKAIAKNNKKSGGKAAPKAEPPQPFSFKLFLKSLGPGLITGASDDDPSGIGTYSQAGAQLGYGIGWTMLLTFPLMAAIQEISARVGRVTGHGISGNVCRHYPSWLLAAVVAHAVHRQHHQYRSRPRRHGGRGQASGWWTCHPLRPVLWRDVGGRADLHGLQTLRIGAEMADAQPVRLRRRTGLCTCFVGRGTGRRADPETDLERGLLHHHRRDLRHHDLALSVLLAGLAGGRRAAGRSAQAPADRQALWRAKGIQSHPCRHHRRHGILQPDRAVDYLYRRRYIACLGQDRHPDFGAGGRSLASDRRQIRRSHLRARHRRHRAAGDPRARGCDRLCGRRGAAVAGRIGAQAEGSGRVLCRAGAVRRFRNRAEFHLDQSDLGAVLERCHQRRARGPRDGAVDVHGAPQGRDGPFCHHRSAILARMALDRGDAAQRIGDGGGVLV